VSGPGGASAGGLGLLAIAGWLLAGACWVASLFLPWASHGALSSASLIDAARLVRRGIVDSVVPEPWSFVLVLPALAGVALFGLAGFRGPVVAAGRFLLAAMATVLVLLLAHRITGGEPARIGAGGWLALVGVAAAAMAAVAVLAERFGSRGEGTH
jgi:hypothetical protein